MIKDLVVKYTKKLSVRDNQIVNVTEASYKDETNHPMSSNFPGVLDIGTVRMKIINYRKHAATVVY